MFTIYITAGHYGFIAMGIFLYFHDIGIEFLNVDPAEVDPTDSEISETLDNVSYQLSSHIL